MKHLRFDFNNMFSHSVGASGGVTDSELSSMRGQIAKAHKHITHILKSEENRIGLGLEWTALPRQDSRQIQRIQELGDEIAGSYENVISLGIGGSYLGLKAAQEALCNPYYNDFLQARNGRPRIFFEGNNMDPDTLSVLIKNLNPKKTFVVVISKSGETTETKAAFAVIEKWLKENIGDKYGRQIVAITDPKSGTLRKKVESEQSLDGLDFRSLPVLKGVGGRFSEFNVGLLHMAIVGVNIREVLDGAASMLRRCSAPSLTKNPAYMYAALQTILYRKKGKCISVIMPFSERLKSTADWYVQLLAESLGKKYGRRIRVGSNGVERWENDTEKIVNVGRTPIAARGTNDLHSIQQNNIEGEDNKTVTFIKVEKFNEDIEVAGTGDFLEGRFYSELISVAEEATEWALTMEGRPSCTIIMPEISAFLWGELLFFFEMATAIEGELLDVNAFDQPGVEGYKNYMYYKLGKTDIPQEVAENIRKHPLIKRPRYIL
ncbi:MAG: glucose-6-phosphate isomerase [Candidatus Omnitrophica bacterium]|nr:glucose-6-phosphate isomerase [Candidatus Omnitrophota bacterium]